MISFSCNAVTFCLHIGIECQNHHSLDTSHSGNQILVHCKFITTIHSISYITVVTVIIASFFVQVIRENLAGPDFVWFLPGWFRANWWAAVDGTDCTAEEMSKGLEHSLGSRGNGALDNDPSRVLVSDKVCYSSWVYQGWQYMYLILGCGPVQTRFGS